MNRLLKIFILIFRWGESMTEEKYCTANFIKDDGSKALVKCPACDQENYALNVLNRMCAWCGFDINAEDKE